MIARYCQESKTPSSDDGRVRRRHKDINVAPSIVQVNAIIHTNTNKILHIKQRCAHVFVRNSTVRQCVQQTVFGLPCQLINKCLSQNHT